MAKLISVKRISDDIFEIEYKDFFRTRKKLVFRKRKYLNQDDFWWKDLDNGELFPPSRTYFSESLSAICKELEIGKIYVVINKPK